MPDGVKSNAPAGTWVNQGGNMIFVPAGRPSTGGGATATAQNPPDSAGQVASTALNVGALLAIADTEPEHNPRNTGGEVLANLYREVARLKGRVSYLEQNS